MSKELEFPIHFKCTNCGANTGIMQIVSEKEKAEGVIPKQEPVATGRHQILLADDAEIKSGKLAGKILRMVHFYTDVCSRCGHQYIYMVNVTEYKMPAMQQQNLAPRRNMNDIIIPGIIPPPFKNKGN